MNTDRTMKLFPPQTENISKYPNIPTQIANRVAIDDLTDTDREGSPEKVRKALDFVTSLRTIRDGSNGGGGGGKGRQDRGGVESAHLLNDERAEEDDRSSSGPRKEDPEHGDLCPPPDRAPPEHRWALRRGGRLGGRRGVGLTLDRHLHLLRDPHVLAASAIGGPRRTHRPWGRDQASIRGGTRPLAVRVGSRRIGRDPSGIGLGPGGFRRARRGGG